MRVVQTRNKKLVFGILLSALIVGVMLTIGQVPLAVSQPVTIPAKAVKGPIPMDGANPDLGRRPWCRRAFERSADHHADASEHLGEVGVREGRDQTARKSGCASSGPIRRRTIRRSVRRISVIRPRSCSRSTPPVRRRSSAWGSRAGPSNIWRWNAEWQKDLGKDSAGIWDVDDQYPGIFWDYYFEEPAGGVTYPDRIGRSLGPFNPGIWSGNIMSDPTLRVSSVEDLNANGFSTLTTQAHQDVIGNGVWEPAGSVKGGCCTGPTWRMVVKRTLGNR